MYPLQPHGSKSLSTTIINRRDEEKNSDSGHTRLTHSHLLKDEPAGAYVLQINKLKKIKLSKLIIDKS